MQRVILERNNDAPLLVFIRPLSCSKSGRESGTGRDDDDDDDDESFYYEDQYTAIFRHESRNGRRDDHGPIIPSSSTTTRSSSSSLVQYLMLSMTSKRLLLRRTLSTATSNTYVAEAKLVSSHRTPAAPDYSFSWWALEPLIARCLVFL